VVTAGDVGENLGVDDAIGCVVTDKEIVDTPSNIARPRAHTIAPPTIGIARIGIKMAEAVGKARLEQFAKTAPLFVGKTCMATVGIGIFEIDLVMCDIEVATGHNRLVLSESRQERAIGAIPCETFVNTC
jgi:hypothetical protein